MVLAEAIYHLGYEVDADQPVIAVHTDPTSLEDLSRFDDKLMQLQEYLEIPSKFDFNTDSFGFGGTGKVEDSEKVAGWAALKLAVPAPETDKDFLGSPTPQLIPIVATLAVTLSHLKDFGDNGSRDPNHPQFMKISLENRMPLNFPYSAPINATLTPTMVEELLTRPNIEEAEEQVRNSLMQTFQYPLASALEEDRFGVSLGEEISFDYPGDGTGFYAKPGRHLKTEGLRLSAANNDFPLQQIAILGGLAALNDIAFE